MLLGLDVGDKRVGVALASAQAGARAEPQPALTRAGGAAEREILKIIRARGITLIVVGLPLNEDGSGNAQCDKIENFCRRLQKRAKLPLEYVDEYLSSVEARERLGVVGKPDRASRKRGVIDSLSASIILQSYVDARRERESLA